MSVENALREALDSPMTPEMSRQISEYRRFERAIKEAGWEIERRTFDIPLMGRVTSGLHQT